jgi:hypothetical protein
MLKSGKVTTTAQAARELSLESDVVAYADTVRNVLKEADFHSMIKKKKPLFTQRHRDARLKFAKKYKDWDVKQWRKVIWSDETQVHRIESNDSHWA